MSIQNQNNNKINISPSCLYGKSEIDSKIHNIKDIIGNNILDYRLTKIKCQIKENEGIYGVELIFKNLITEEEKSLINIKSEEPNLIEQEIILDFEIILDVKFWCNDENKLIGFEVNTNKGKFQKFGYGNDSQLKLCHELKNKERVVVGFCLYEREKKGITGMFLYHMNKRTYAFYIYKGIFSLRIKIKDDKYKNEIEKTLDKIDDNKKKILFKICCLSDNQFFNVIKYTLN